MRPDDKNRLAEDFALGEALRRSAAPVAPANADFRLRIAAIADRTPTPRTRSLFRRRVLPVAAAAAAGLLLFVAAPVPSARPATVTASVEEGYVWETFAEAFDESEGVLPWEDAAVDGNL